MPEIDPIDADFIDVDDEGPSFPKPSKRKRWPWRLPLAVILLIAAGYGVHQLWSRYEERSERATIAAWPPGYFDLLDCAEVRSFDGSKELELDDNSRAVLWDSPGKQKSGEYHSVTGSWTFDPATKLYTIRLDGKAVEYALSKPFRSCILVKGTPNAADLSASWFASTSDDGVDYDYRPPPPEP
jgi:hypothetical protein